MAATAANLGGDGAGSSNWCGLEQVRRLVVGLGFQDAGVGRFGVGGGCLWVTVGMGMGGQAMLLKSRFRS